MKSASKSIWRILPNDMWNREQAHTLMAKMQGPIAILEFTYCKNGGKLPVTKGKPGNYCLPIGKLSLPTGIFGGKGKFEKVNLR